MKRVARKNLYSKNWRSVFPWDGIMREGDAVPYDTCMDQRTIFWEVRKNWRQEPKSLCSVTLFYMTNLMPNRQYFKKQAQVMPQVYGLLLEGHTSVTSRVDASREENLSSGLWHIRSKVNYGKTLVWPRTAKAYILTDRPRDGHLHYLLPVPLVVRQERDTSKAHICWRTEKCGLFNQRIETERIYHQYRSTGPLASESNRQVV